MEGLGEVIIGACAERNEFTVFIIERGHNDDGSAEKIKVCTQQAAKLETIWFGHHEVQYEKVGLFGVG